MQYVSREPRITGWYDADQLHSRIDQAVSEGATSNYDVQKVLANEAGTWDMFKIAGATWNTPLKSFGFGSTTSDGDSSRLDEVDPDSRCAIDEFHPDTLGGEAFLYSARNTDIVIPLSNSISDRENKLTKGGLQGISTFFRRLLGVRFRP